MNLLLDTHALIWWLAGDERLSAPARAAIEEMANNVAVSAASSMEVSTKFRLGKLHQATLLALNFEAIVRSQGFAELAISIRHAAAAGAMNIAHKDPFDRLLIAQAQSENMVLVSNKEMFDDEAVLVSDLEDAVVYVGKTVMTIAKQCAVHVCAARSKETALARAIRKHGIENFVIESVWFFTALRVRHCQSALETLAS